MSWVVSGTGLFSRNFYPGRSAGFSRQKRLNTPRDGYCLVTFLTCCRLKPALRHCWQLANNFKNNLHRFAHAITA
jgi:hypothetical protein